MSEEAQALPPGDVPQDPNAGAPSAAAQSADATPSSAQPASSDAGTSPSAANSAAEPMTFEQRVEQRFLALEQALMGMPHSIHTVLSSGSMDAESFGKAVLAHLFGKQ